MLLKTADSLVSGAESWNRFSHDLKALGNSESANKNKGDAFERLVQFFLTYQPEYQQQLEEVWLYDEIPFEIKQELNISDTDRGIDLVAKTKKGEYWAIQAKYRSDTKGSIPLSELGTFGTQLGVVARGFARGVICATKREKTPDFARATFPVEQILLDTWESIEDETWASIRKAAAGEKVEPLVPFKPRQYQADAVTSAKRHFVKDGKRRGKLIMPCGTGKSLMGYWTTVKALKAKTVIVAVPSLDLIRQTFAVWAREAAANRKHLDVLIVCSDKSTAEGDSHVDDLAAPATTDPGEIKQWLRHPQQQSHMRVVFVTYQSGKVFADAAGRFQFDVGLYDEAHKTAGYEGKGNQYLLHQKNLNVLHRVFMTATERYYEGESDEVVGMNDKRLYGERYHYMPFGEAINKGILADYSVVLLAIHRSEAERFRPLIEDRMFVRPNLESAPEEISADDLATAVALRKALKKYKLNHAVSFHSRNQQAMEFVDIQRSLNGAGLSATLKTYRVSSSISTGKRHEQLKGFEQAKRALISNARCLTEGVDVPGIDLVLFAQPRQSKVDIVQAVGRALRVPSDHPDKRGYVLVPVLVDDDEDDLENIVKGTGFENLVSVLKAMATVDDNITDRIEVVVAKGKRGQHFRSTDQEAADILPEKIRMNELAEALRLRAWDRLEGLRKSRLTEEQILDWADRHRERNGRWPTLKSNEISEAPDMTWQDVQNALVLGLRGLTGGSSLAKLLYDHRGARNIKSLPALFRGQILDWAKTHKERTGKWPSANSGEIQDQEETWSAVNGALIKGTRGLPGKSSLTKFLHDELGVRNSKAPPTLSVEQILEWVEAHRKKTGKFPRQTSGDISDAPGETWSGVHQALLKGNRGLAGDSSLVKLLEERFGIRNRNNLSPLVQEEILGWAKAYHSREGKWPNQKSGRILEAPEETWSGVDHALSRGHRGLPGGGTLAKLLQEKLNVRNIKALDPFSEEKLLAWADAHKRRTAKWPRPSSGNIPEDPGETWLNVQNALRMGLRGLPGGSSVAKLLQEKRGVRNIKDLPSLSEYQILDWAKTHKERTGKWPSANSGEIQDQEETWSAVNGALIQGNRGLPGGSSLAKLIAGHQKG